MKGILHEPQLPASSPTKDTGDSPMKAPLEKAPIKLDDLPEDLLLDAASHLDAGSHLDAHSWLALRQTSKTGGLQDALQSASVVRAVMQAQQTPPPIIDTLLSAPGDTAAARAHLTAQAQLRARLIKSPLTISLRVPTNSVPRVSVHPDGLGVVHWCTQRFPLHQWGGVNALAYYDLSQRAAGKPQAITLRPLVPRDVFPTDVAFAPDGKALYVALANGNVLRLQRAPMPRTRGVRRPRRCEPHLRVRGRAPRLQWAAPYIRLLRRQFAIVGARGQ